MRALITGARLPMARAIAKALKMQNIEVIVADSLDYPFTRFSKYADDYIKLPAPALDLQGFYQTVIKTIRERGIDLVIPVNEEIFFLSRIKEDIEKTARLFCGTATQLETLHSKWHYRSLVEGCGAEIPKSRYVKDPSSLLHALNELGNCIIKPEFSRGSFRTVLSPSWEQATLLSIEESNPLIVQKLISGTEFCTYSVFNNGKLLAHACYNPLYRIGKGSGIYFEPVHHLAILDFTRAFGLKNSFTGQVAFDIIEDNTKKLYVIECNPRATAGIHLMENFQDWGTVFLGNETTFYDGATSPPRMAGLAVFFLCAADEFRKGRLKEFTKRFWRARDVLFDWRDPLPFISQIVASVELLKIAGKNNKTVAEIYNFGLEWDGHKP
ncbi:MAG: ATP-grasp domain-containing protein [Alphaproteobacteria bacterium]|nr:ATP-grasp domain-containing protein [Alphaproteobacteria bacterium]MBP7761922.1 ATP-grasp domain-containing protein [Alphaproteobacteria bacterium]